MAKAKSKKEIDKDIMYSKIMPTGLRKTAAEEPEEADGKESSGGAREEKAPAPVPPAAGLEENPAFLKRSGVKLKEANPTIVANLMEALVADKIDSAFSKFNCCKCDKCRKDVVAIALNMLRPNYIVCEKDEIAHRSSHQTNAEVYTAIVKAILQVRSHPRH